MVIHVRFHTSHITAMEEGSAFINGTVDVGNIDFTIPPIEYKMKVTTLSVMLLVGMVTNVFIIFYTVCHHKSLKQSSIVLLLGSSVMILVSHARSDHSFTGSGH